MTDTPATTTDHFLGGARSIISVLRPRFHGWIEVATNPKLLEMGGVARTFIHEDRNISVISAVEVADDGKIDKGPESARRDLDKSKLA